MGKPTIHHSMINTLAEEEDKDVTCFILDKEERQIIESLHLDQKTSTKRKASFQELIKDKGFNARFFDLFLGASSVSERIKRFYDGKGWKFDSLLILYYNKRKRIFIQDLPESAFFLNADEATFMALNTHYSLISYNYNTNLNQKITITINKMAQRFDALLDGKTIGSRELKREIMATFPVSSELINQFLAMITHKIPNECRFYFDRMAVIVKTVGNKYTIENYDAR
jgi:hypothetical protein